MGQSWSFSRVVGLNRNIFILCTSLTLIYTQYKAFLGTLPYCYIEKLFFIASKVLREAKPTSHLAANSRTGHDLWPPEAPLYCSAKERSQLLPTTINNGSAAVGGASRPHVGLGYSDGATNTAAQSSIANVADLNHSARMEKNTMRTD